MYKSGIIWLLLGFPWLVQSQPVNEHLWSDVYNYIKLNNRLEMSQELGLRIRTGDHYVWQYNIRSSLTYQLNKTFSVVGAINFHNFDTDFRTRSFEVRPWQGVKMKFPHNLPIAFNHQVRLEHRFIHFQQEKQMVFSERFRYEISSKIPVIFNKQRVATVFIPVSEEIMLNFSGQSERLPQINRLNLGLGVRLNESTTTEVAYVSQHSRSTGETSFIHSDNLYRFKLRYYWN